MITLEALQVIDSIDRKGSFSAAAEELFRVPSALTYAVKKLEQDLNVKIFDRSGQRAVLTPAGRLLLEGGRDVLQQVQQLEERTRRVESGWETQLRVVVDTILPVEPLLPLVAELQQWCSWLDIQILEEALSGSWEALANQRADLVLGVTSVAANHQWQRKVIGKLRMSVFCASDHPLARHGGVLSVADLQAYAHIVINDSARNLPARDVGLMGIRQKIYVPNMQHKYLAIKNGLGVSHLPHYLGVQGVANGELAELEVEDQNHYEDLFMVWRRSDEGRANAWLREAVVANGVYKGLLLQD